MAKLDCSKLGNERTLFPITEWSRFPKGNAPHKGDDEALHLTKPAVDIVRPDRAVGRNVIPLPHVVAGWNRDLLWGL